MEQNRNLDDRYAIFEEMDRIFCKDPDFFLRNPISVVWNEKGWFNIQDGNNRAAFLLARGIYSIPVQLTDSDYDAWVNVDKAVQRVESALNDISGALRSPILHPRFQDLPCALNFYSHKKTVALCDWLWREQLDPESLRICEYDCSNDLCVSHLARMGGHVTVVDVPEQIKLHKALDALYQLNTVRYGLEDTAPYQIIISNQAGFSFARMGERMQAEWYVLEYVDTKDEEIEATAAHYDLEAPEYIVRQLVGSRIYKVATMRRRQR